MARRNGPVKTKTAPSSDQTRARKRYRPVHAYVAATFIGTFSQNSPYYSKQYSL
jgi:hypothetical protein